MKVANVEGDIWEYEDIFLPGHTMFWKDNDGDNDDSGGDNNAMI